MSEALTRLDYGRSLAFEAAARGGVLAKTPMVVFDQRTQRLEGALHIPTDEIIDFAAEEINVNPLHLSSMAICVYDRERDQQGKSPIYRCHTSGKPRAFGDNPDLHFPILALGVEQSKSGNVRTRAVNNELRHQIWHLKEQQQESWLLHPVTIGAGRMLAGAGALFFGGLAAYSYARGEASDMVGNGFAALGSAGLARNRTTHELMDYLSLREVRASAFSIKNYGFTPIKPK